MNRHFLNRLVRQVCSRNYSSSTLCSRPFLNWINIKNDTVKLISTTSHFRKAHAKKEFSVNVSKDDVLLYNAVKEFNELKERLTEEFNRHFSMRTDLRIYEECKVALREDEVHKMNELGRITMRNPKTIAINFDDYPSAIKAAKTALQSSALCMNPQQEGTTLYISVPEPSRELREKTSEKARFILNDYKKALNTTFSKYSSKNDTEKNMDVQRKRREALIAAKRKFDAFGEQLIKEKREAIMKEIA